MTTESQSSELSVPLDVVDTKLRVIGVLSGQREVIMSELREVGMLINPEDFVAKPSESIDSTVSELRRGMAALNRQNDALLAERNKLAEENRALKGKNWRNYLRYYDVEEEVMEDILKALEEVLSEDTPLAKSLRESVEEALVGKAIKAAATDAGDKPFDLVWEKATERLVEMASEDTVEAKAARLKLIEGLMEEFQGGRVNDKLTFDLLNCLGLGELNEDILLEFFRLRSLNLNPEERSDLTRAITYVLTHWRLKSAPKEQSTMDLTS